jgi:hypothetical protein
MDTLGMAQSGYSNFLRRNGRTNNAVAAMLDCILTRERVAILQPRGYNFLSLASSVFDLEKLGGDGIGALQRLTATLSSDWFSYVSHAIEHMRRVAEQRRAERALVLSVVGDPSGRDDTY